MQSQPNAPSDFTNPNEKEIIELEQQYSKGLANGSVFSVLKALRVRIKVLKSELGIGEVVETEGQIKQD